MSIAGSWQIYVDTPMGRQSMRLDARTEDAGEGRFTGTVEGTTGVTVQVLDGALDGDRATWKARFTRPLPMELNFDAAVTGDELTGVVRANVLGASALTGTRVAAAS